MRLRERCALFPFTRVLLQVAATMILHVGEPWRNWSVYSIFSLRCTKCAAFTWTCLMRWLLTAMVMVEVVVGCWCHVSLLVLTILRISPCAIVVGESTTLRCCQEHPWRRP
ncbi:uncharacterized protein K489DRAFT_46409 [Dissoconium aciculare CBS 342.82]|uniref:Uncharacterized protein n=1 Tax=Dissoconium aciculare CBS 342.82 TaxID=1314786 RepID=A0A6J3LWE1_9PEZI|nr:uncharacterized protein K489DRAFT_46409 [Dissoconium aciculare CBS 342.82]KAF1820086.1 hypothetical protein K489DRAFT_46409 [Dissoconium aciculare CBS 342.82]